MPYNKLKLNSRNIFLNNIFNLIFVSFIFLSGIKYDYLQIRFLIFILIFPCIVKILFEKNFSNVKTFLFFFLILVIHSLVNIYFENSKLTLYNFNSIIFLTIIFIISFYYFDDFNKNIIKIINLFLIIFFLSVSLSFFKHHQSGDNLFCGGIKIFEILTLIDKYFPFNFNLEGERIKEIKFSLEEYIFKENSHLGMVAPSIIIYLIYFNTKNKTSLLNKSIIFIFIFICTIKSSTTLLIGTSLSLLLITFFNYKVIPVNTLKLFTLIFIFFISILTFDTQCRSRFVPIFLLEKIGNINNSKVEVTKQTNKIFVNSSGNLTSQVHSHAIKIALESIIDKPFGWGINRYDVAFKYFNEKNPPEIERLNKYNNKDGTNNFVKIVVEFGIFSILFYFFIILFLVNKKIPINLKFFYLPFIITQSIRGAGYFNGGFALILFLMLFTYLNAYKKTE